MRFPFRRVVSLGMTAALIALVAYQPFAASVSSAQDAVPPIPTTGDTAAVASLHNPNLDNGDWYEFNGRYGHYLWGCWVPDDDNNKPDQNPLPATLQDWRLWFQNGTDIVEVDPEQTYRHSGSEAVQIRPFGTGTQIAGLYQIIYDTVPCLTYQFQMYAQSRPEGSDDSLTALQVGINPGDWYPTLPDFPAVTSFGNTIWGASSNAYKWSYGLLSVTAEVTNTRATVWTYGDARGGRSHRILWDSASFQEVTPGLIPDPNNPPAATIGSVTVMTTSTAAALAWSTALPALGQVYYRALSCPSAPISPTDTLTHMVYLPLVNRYTTWSSTTLNKTLLTSHSETITGLQAGCTYEYIVASRGPSGVQCVTWVSDKRTFTTAP